MKIKMIYFLSGLFLFSVYACQPGEPETKRILTLGVRHESNTFSTERTDLADFSITRGEEALKGQLWAEVFRKEGVEVIPTLHAYSWPGGIVEHDVFKSFMEEILDSIRSAGPLDGIYMDMHGALHAEGYDDAQATLISEIRKQVGEEVLICGSFDLHGNPSPDFVQHLDMLTAFRTAPHRDGDETKARAAQMLVDAMNNHWKPVLEYVVIPILVPGEKSITEVEPLHSIYARLPGISEKEGLMDASIFAGYCWADLPRSAMRVFVTARDEEHREAARNEAVYLARQIWENRQGLELDVPSGSVDDMIDLAAAYPGKTVFITDSGDNTTAGAPGDNPQVVEALLRHGVSNAVMAGVVDPEALDACARAGAGADIALELGGKIDYVFGSPLKIEGKVTFVSPADILDTDRGAAIVETGGVKVVIIRSRRSFVEVSDFTEVGLDPLSFDIVVVKLGYLYPELRDIAPVHLMALTPGFCSLDIPSLPYRHVTRPSYPLDADMEWEPVKNRYPEQ